MKHLILYCLLVAACLPFSAYAETPLDESNSWAFNAGNDPFTADALLDLRDLNEEYAGQHGFIALSKDGMSFTRGDGEPIRFWSILRRVDGRNDPSAEELEYFYRLLAKRGVNMVRLFGQLSNNAEGASLEAVDDEQVRRFQQHVAIAKKNGIYSVISPYWSHSKAPASWNIEGLEKGGSPYGLIFSSERFRQAYVGWMRELLTRPNPYTNIPLKDEPAVAILQVQNEDSILWFQIDNLPEPQKRNLRRAYADWLVERYGSLEKAFAAWPNASLKKDSLGKKEADLYVVWSLGQAAQGDEKSRTATQLQFYTEYQRSIYKSIGQAFEQWGASQLTSASNWRTANDNVLLDIERYSYTSLDVIATNRYTSTPAHTGEKAKWSIRNGHRYANHSVLRNPESMPLRIKQLVGHPFLLTEHMWIYPNLYKAEGPFLTSAYAALTGIDSTVWSMATDSAENVLETTRWKSPWIHKFNAMGPEILGQFPAAALAFRKGLIAEAKAPAVKEKQSFADMWSRAEKAIAEGRSYDPLRDTEEFEALQTAKAEELKVNSRAFLVGPVWLESGAEESGVTTMELDRYIKTDSTTSMTGQIQLNHEKGYCLVNTPAFQGACGFFENLNEPVRLGSVTIESANQYAAVYVVSMDDKPIEQSERILIQVGTQYRPTGWSTKPATVKKKRSEETVEGMKIINVGKAPWRAANTHVTIHINNDRISKATLVNENGYAAAPVPLTARNQGFTIRLPENAMYVILQ